MLAIYELAYHLRVPVYRLIDEMPYEELLCWFEYFERRPPGWQEDDRTFKLLQAQGVKEKAQNIFPALAKIYGQPQNKQEDGKLDGANLKASLMFHKMLSAEGGDKLDL